MVDNTTYTNTNEYLVTLITL